LTALETITISYLKQIQRDEDQQQSSHD